MVVRHSMFDEMSSLFRNFDNLFQSALRDASAYPMTQRLLEGRPAGEMEPALFPAVEYFAGEKDVVLRAELPGVDPEKVEITVQGDRLTLRAEKETRHKEEKGDSWFQEVAYGRFERSFVLPEGVKAEDIRASIQNGVLEVTFPVKETAESKRIPISAGPGEKKELQAS